MKIRFQIDPDRLTLNDLIAIEEQSDSPVFMRDFCQGLLLTKMGITSNQEKALDMVGNLTLTEIAGAVGSFSESVEGLQEKLLPKVKGSQ